MPRIVVTPTRLLIALLAVLLILTGTVAGLVLHSREDPEVLSKSRYGYPPGYVQVEYGDPPARVRRLLGAPASSRAGCWRYRDLAAQTTRYRICFEDGRVSAKSVD